jgi:tetratricopeptide (TPR) repeat protein
VKLRVLAIVVVVVFVQGAAFAQTENAATWNNRGVQYYNQGNYEKAIECFLEVKTIIEKTLGKEHLEYATSLINLGLLYDKTGDYPKAERCYLEAKTIYEKTLGKQHLYYATSVNNLGLLYYNMGDYAKAESNYLEARAIWEKALGKEHPDYAVSLNSLGGLYDNMGDYSKAERYYLEAKAIWEKTLGKEHPNYATLLNNLGWLYYNMGDYAKAERCHLEARTIREKTLGKAHPDYAQTLNNIAGLYAGMGDYAKAESNYLEAKAIREKAFGKEHPDYATSAHNLGWLYYSMGDYPKAERCYLEAKTIYEKILGKQHSYYAASVNNLGLVYHSMGDYAKAERYYLEARAIYEKQGKGHPSYAKSINNLGLVYYNMGDYAKAERCFLEAGTIYEKVLGKEHPDYALLADNLFTLYLSKKDYKQALTYKQEQIKIKTGIVNQNFSFQTEQQRDAYWNANSYSFEITYSLSLNNPVPASNILNYDNALFSKGLLLRTTNAVRDSIYASGNKALISQFEELSRIRQQISALRQSGGNEAYIKSLETQAETLDKNLTKSSAAFREFQSDLAVNWQSVQKNLQAKEAAIEFVSFKIYDKKITDKVQYAALVVKPGMNAPVWVPLCEESVLTALFDEMSGWGDPKYEALLFYDENGLSLYNAVWQPLEKVLESVTAVYYSPSGLLHKISFNAIPVKGNTGVRLMDAYDLNLVSSTREVINKKTKTAGKPNSAVVYGGLEYNVDPATMRKEALAYNKPETEIRVSAALPANSTRGGSWNFLGGSLNESRDVQNLLEGKQLRVIRYSGVKGNKESFKDLSGKKMAIIHLATHGFFLEDIEKDYEKLERLGGGQKASENQLLRSGLILAGGNNAWSGKAVEGVENGILFADDVAKMNLLGTELVALSACVTALGKVNNSEGVFGLQRAFKLAGAQTLVMSLWEVDDKGTSLIMGEFYRNWLSGMSKQEAFKRAQQTLRKDSNFAQPYYWAAFVMMD